MKAPAGVETRPMMDRVKEALFSSLAARVPDARVLDLYAGSGALGIESLSRGAASVTFVERGRGALEALRSNLATLEFDGKVVAADVKSFLAGSVGSYDLAFVDPPYRLSLALVGEVLEGAAALLANGGVMVVHRQAGEEAPDSPSGTSRIDDRRYGRTQLWIYERDES